MQQQKYRQITRHAYRYRENRYPFFTPFLATKYANQHKVYQEYIMTEYTPQIKDVQKRRGSMSNNTDG
jgi:hypothetical protein